MSGNQSEEGLSKEPLIMGLYIFAPISSVAGSATLSVSQPFLSERIFASSAVLIGSELFLFIAQRLFRFDSIPVLDVKNGQTVQMPLSELQEFLRWMATGSDSNPNSNPATDGRNMLSNEGGEFTGTIGSRGFLTPESTEAPIIVSLYVAANYSNRSFTPGIFLVIPIFTFPGLRGALPMLILGLLATIFVRAVVQPESTGSKPLSKSGTRINNPLTHSPNDLLQLLTKFRNKPGTN